VSIWDLDVGHQLKFRNNPPNEEGKPVLDRSRGWGQELPDWIDVRPMQLPGRENRFREPPYTRLAPLVAGRRAHPRVKFLITSGRLMKELAEEAGVLAPIVEFGAQITLDTCILASPMLPAEIQTLMTNSAKYAYYAPSLLNTRVTFGSLADCVRSAIEGRVVRDESVWQTA